MKYTAQGAFYTTEDLIRMCQLESFGQHSGMIGRALIKLKLLEEENKQLKEVVKQLQTVDAEKAAGNTFENLM